jgi:uncharacterized membrane protein
MFFMFVVLFSSFASIALADDDTSGNIRIEVTKLDKLDNSLPYLVFVVIGVVVVIAVVLSVLLIFRSRRSSQRPSKSAVELNLRPGSSAELKIEGYYGGVFQKILPEVEIIDEKASSREVASEAESKNGGDVDRYLKEDERIVINVLRMKHNSCTQATIRVVTDFSKARLSRILSELEERGIIFKEQQGRKNLITLKDG